MNVVFLDIDGVLNCKSTKDRFNGVIGIESEKVVLLSRIVSAMNAKIVLTSTWKYDWDPQEPSDHGIYLNAKLAECGLSVLDKTYDRGCGRGAGICNYIAEHPEVEHWLVLDDTMFVDFAETGVAKHLVQTSWNDGLTERKVQIAKKMYTEGRLSPSPYFHSLPEQQEDFGEER